MNKKEILKEVDTLIATYCEGCFIKSTLNKEKSKTHAHRFCIQQCTVGEKIKQLGKHLHQ